MINDQYAQARARSGGVNSKTLYRIKHLRRFAAKCARARSSRLRQGYGKVPQGCPKGSAWRTWRLRQTIAQARGSQSLTAIALYATTPTTKPT